MDQPGLDYTIRPRGRFGRHIRGGVPGLFIAPEEQGYDLGHTHQTRAVASRFQPSLTETQSTSFARASVVRSMTFSRLEAIPRGT